ncbi:MAG: molybdate ABC transporter substrate-binding protein [Kofleriaceae bacterium]
MRVVLLLLVAAACSSKSSGRTVRIAAAADLSKAFEEIGKEFTTRTGIKPQFTFGSSGLLSKQISEGAPYFLFAAANEKFAQQAVQAGRCDAASAKFYARGRIVVWTPSDVVAPVNLSDLADAKRFKKIAIANPEHAPYGLAARQALEKSNLWSQLESRMVLGENVQATMLYARDHNADAAIVALSLAVVTEGGSYLRIDPALHAPLDQQLVVCGNGEEADAARQFADFVGSRDGREIMIRYGFLLPEEQPPK